MNITVIGNITIPQTYQTLSLIHISQRGVNGLRHADGVGGAVAQVSKDGVLGADVLDTDGRRDIAAMGRHDGIIAPVVNVERCV